MFLTRALFLLILGCCYLSRADEQQNDWSIKVHAVLANTNLTESVKMQRYLDALSNVVMLTVKGDYTNAWDVDFKYAQGIYYLTTIGPLPNRVSFTNAQHERIEILEQKRGELEQRRDSYSLEMKSLLSIALALKGKHAEEADLLKFIARTYPQPQLILVSLEAMENTEVPRAAIPYLRKLADHPYSYVEWTDLGTPLRRRVFPVRDAVFACMKKLDLKVKRVETVDEMVDREWGVKLSVTTILEGENCCSDGPLRAAIITSSH